MKKAILLSLLILPFLFTACGPNYIFDQEFKISEEGWTYADTLNFAVEITDTTSIYNLYLDINHSTEYARQNIYMMIHTQFPSGQRIKERLSVDLANRAGQWYGKCDSESCDLRLNIQEGAFFNALGPHKITIEQYMRIDPLLGVNSIALRIEDTGQRR